jgi:hypothetical protein
MSFDHKFAAASPRRAALVALLALGAGAALADPADYVFTPYTDIGKWQLAWGAGVEHARDGSRATQQVLSVGGAPVARWYTSVYAAWAAGDGGPYTLDEWSWTNHVALTVPGAGPADVGLLCELSRPRARSEGRLGAACGPTLQMDTDQFQFNLDLSLGKHFGATDPERPQLGYQWQVKGLLAQGLELGAQGFGSLGPWNAWASTAQQEHILGPAMFVKTTALGGPVRLDAAVLFGIGQGSPRNVLRVRLQHEF